MWKTLYSLTFGNNQSIVLRKKNNTLLHSKPLNQSSRISKSQRTRPHPGFSTRLWCVNIKKVLSLGLYRHSSFCLLCHQMFCEWVKMVAATATPLEAAVCASHSLTLGSVTELSIGFSGNTTTPTMQSLKTRPGRGEKNLKIKLCPKIHTDEAALHEVPGNIFKRTMNTCAKRDIL